MKNLLITSISCATVLLASVLPAAAQPAVSEDKKVNVNFDLIKSQIPENFTDLPSIIGRIFTVTITAAGGIFVIMLLFGGIEYLTGAGNEESTKKGKARMIDATIGIVITLSAWAIGTFVLNQFYSGGSSPGSTPSSANPRAIQVTAVMRDQNGQPVKDVLILIDGFDKGKTDPQGRKTFTIEQGPGQYTLKIVHDRCTNPRGTTETAQFGPGTFTRTLNCIGTGEPPLPPPLEPEAPLPPPLE